VTRPAQAIDPDAARRDAQDILRDRRFHSDPAPRPLRGPLEWLSDRLRTIGHWIGDVLGHIPSFVWLAIGIAIVAAVVARVVVISRRRRVATPAGGARPPTGERRERAEDLEREADDAERDGDLDRALRLRFRAGLLRLGARGAIDYRPSVTTGEVRRALGSETFDDLAGTFESVAYAGRPAEPPDVETARREWPRVLDEAGHR